jgi:hypothetical protein
MSRQPRHRHQASLRSAGLLCLVFAGLTPLAWTQDVLVPFGATWRYSDDGSTPAPDWRSPSYDDSGWSAGPAKLGYGDSDIVTEVDYGPFSFFKHETTWFRHTFSVADPTNIGLLQIDLVRDDGAAISLNGIELARSNLPGGTLGENSLALSDVNGSDEQDVHVFTSPATALVAGTNVLAVEVHQSSPLSSDLGFDLSLSASSDIDVTRGPYLQLATPTSIHIRWRTGIPTDARVRYGLASGPLDQVADQPGLMTEHEVEISGLQPDTAYDYTIGTSGLDSGLGATFHTAPIVGSTDPLRVWVIGDSGTANANAAAVRDAFETYTAATHPDVWLMLGDNAYNEGSDSQYQAAVFDMYAERLARTPVWPTRGNHEVIGSAYFGAFSLPTGGEAGGLPSGAESYYSFDHGNVHFICLNSYELFDATVGGAMWTWLEADLDSTNQEWVIAYWHHPPYSKGSHDSDTSFKLTQMRLNFVPLLEAGGVDLVLSGHSHGYERSYLIDGHYGPSWALLPFMLLDTGDGRIGSDGPYRKAAGPHAGAIYCVAGSSGKTTSAPFDHPIMFHSVATLGSVVLDIAGPRLDAVFLDSQGGTDDHFTLTHTVCAEDLGGAGPGSLRIEACGDELTFTGSTMAFELTGAPPGSLVYLPTSFLTTPTPFAGGTLVPDILGVVLLRITDPTGSLMGVLPGAVGEPTPIYVQAVVLTPAGPLLSNALEVLVGVP